MKRRESTLSRRHLIGGVPLLALGPLGGLGQGTPVRQETCVIELPGAPDTLDPALGRSYRDWSVLHSIYDSIVHLNTDGTIVPLAASSFTSEDAVTWRVTLRPGLRFHDGSPVTSQAIAQGIRHVQQSEGPAAASFSVISDVTIVDDLAATIVTSAPAPWLPSQLAVWHVLLPASATPESVLSRPNGSGPYRFSGMDPGVEVSLEANQEYTWASPKGTPFASIVLYRAVPEVATRVADLITGAANLIAAVDLDSRSALETDVTGITDTPIFGTALIRIATDVEPFSDPRIGRALNMAIDADSIATTLVHPDSHRLASLFPRPGAIGYDPSLQPFEYDPEGASGLLAEAGYADGIDVDLEFASGEQTAVLEAIAAQLADVDIRVTLKPVELAVFNGSWRDTESAPLRYLTWRPVFDPYTLLDLMFTADGPLSRSTSVVLDELIHTAGAEPQSELRASSYRQVGIAMQESPPAIPLWNLISSVGSRDVAASWRPRADEWMIATGGTS